MEDKKNQTTSKHFEIFKKEAELWLERLGLIDYRVEFFHKEISKDALAVMDANIDGRVATITLAIDWSHERISTYQLKRTAFHEVIELLLARIGYLGECRFLQNEEIPEEKHNIIRRLENFFYGNTSSKTIKKV